jgi:hypothetical protein
MPLKAIYFEAMFLPCTVEFGQRLMVVRDARPCSIYVTVSKDSERPLNVTMMDGAASDDKFTVGVVVDSKYSKYSVGIVVDM